MKRSSEVMAAILYGSLLVGCASSEDTQVTNRDMGPDPGVSRQMTDRYDLEQTGVKRQAGVTDMGVSETAFRTDYDSLYANRGMTYEQVRPAYRFGYLLANDPHYTGLEWSRVQSEARSEWEKGYPNSWPQYKDAIHYGWEQGRRRTGGPGLER
jgi:hypothetical protein